MAPVITPGLFRPATAAATETELVSMTVALSPTTVTVALVVATTRMALAAVIITVVTATVASYASGNPF